MGAKIINFHETKEFFNDFSINTGYFLANPSLFGMFKVSLMRSIGVLLLIFCNPVSIFLPSQNSIPANQYLDSRCWFIIYECAFK